MALATLSIDLEARLASLQQGMDKAVRIAERESARMTKAFSVAGSALAGIGAGVGVTAITRYFGSIVDGVDALNDLADATGASIENLSALEGVALRTGTSVETVGASLVKFNKVLSDAKPGSDAAAALEALGLNAEELKRIDPAEALRQTAAALAGFADDGNKARIVQELFGKSVQEVAPFLKNLAEQRALDARLTKEQVEEAQKFNQQLYALQAAAVDASRAIAGPLVTSMNTFIDKMREAQKEGRLAAAVSEDLITRLSKVAPLQLQFAVLAARVLNRGPVGNEPGAPQPPGFRPSQNYGDRFVPSLPGSVGGTPARAASGRSARAAAQEIGFAITDSAALTKNLFLQSEKDYERIDELLARTEDRAREAAETLRKSLAQEGAAVFEATRTPAERLGAEIDRLNKLLQAGAIDWDTYARAQFEAQDSYDKATQGVKKQVEETNKLVTDLGFTFSSAFEDAVVGGNSLRDVLKGLEADILRIVTRNLITAPLGDAISGALKGAGGIGGLFEGASALFSGFFASGGFIPPGRWGVVGEQGPEPAFGGRSGLTVAPAGGGMSVQNTFVLNGPMDSRTQQQIAAITARSVQSAARRYN